MERCEWRPGTHVRRESSSDDSTDPASRSGTLERTVRRLSGLPFLTLTLVLLGGGSAMAAVKPTPYEGDALPPFALSDTEGARHSLSDHRGDVVLVNFWATWCGPCIREMPSLQRLETELADRPFTLLAVNMGEEPATLLPFLERLDVDLTVLLDQDGAVARDWGVFAYPTTVLIDPDGRARYIARGELDWAGSEALALIESMMPVDEGTGAVVLRTDVPIPVPPVENVIATPRLGKLRRFPPIIAPAARDPDLAARADGTVFASWLEASGETGAALRVARLDEAGWSEPVTATRGSNWFVSWADFPTLSPMGEDGLAVTWSVRNGDGPYGYDLNVAMSRDGGTSWSEPLVPHRDGTPTQHGLASLTPMEDGRLLVTWLDGRVNDRAGDTSNGADLPTTDMTLRSAFVTADGVPADDTLLDERVCSCCATASVALDNGGALVAYRDRSADEVRDIAVRRFRDGRWEPSRAVHDDGWQIAGCPINGPALAARGVRVALVWFTAASDSPTAQLVFSEDGGDRFEPPIRIDDGRPLGRTDVVMLEDGSALVSWLEVTAHGEELRVRLVTPDGERLPSMTIVRSNRGRTIGFPRMAIVGDDVVIAWTAPDTGGAIGSAMLALPDGSGD